jgi:hypothetical protein
MPGNDDGNRSFTAAEPSYACPDLYPPRVDITCGRCFFSDSRIHCAEEHGRPFGIGRSGGVLVIVFRTSLFRIIVNAHHYPLVLVECSNPLVVVAIRSRAMARVSGHNRCSQLPFEPLASLYVYMLLHRWVSDASAIGTTVSPKELTTSLAFRSARKHTGPCTLSECQSRAAGRPKLSVGCFRCGLARMANKRFRDSLQDVVRRGLALHQDRVDFEGLNPSDHRTVRKSGHDDHGQ